MIVPLDTLLGTVNVTVTLPVDEVNVKVWWFPLSSAIV
jgi:hypothetical protein